jgi:hypothetical protein
VPRSGPDVACDPCIEFRMMILTSEGRRLTGWLADRSIKRPSVVTSESL